jgi:MFS transporter, MFS domain-containing protein family, molybdate-anion transporter
MYLFVFLWVPALQESASSSSTLPLGLIISSFMIAMMLGSILYTTITSSTYSSLLVHARLSSLVCGLGSVALSTSVAYKEERQRFWAFCLFEACAGMYYPVQGMLRGTLISNEHRATVRGLDILITAN